MTSFRGTKLPFHWSSINDSLLFKQHSTDSSSKAQENPSKKFAGFDFDDTLVRKEGDGLAFPTVLTKLRELHDQGFHLIIFSNESLDHLKNPSAISSTISKKAARLDRFIEKLSLPIQIFVATKYDEYRKPSTKDRTRGKACGNKMWFKMIELNGMKKEDVDMEASFYVGDASGKPGEFSDADLQFAKSVGVKFIHANEFFRKTKVLETVTKSDLVKTTTTTTLVVDKSEEEEDEVQIVEKEEVSQSKKRVKTMDELIKPKSTVNEIKEKKAGEFNELEELKLSRKRVKQFDD